MSQASPAKSGMAQRLFSMPIEKELDIVTARQKARQIAQLAGLSVQDQNGLATAVSEIARNAFQYGRGGQVEFEIDLNATPQFLWVSVRDAGPGIADPEAVMNGDWKSPSGAGNGILGTRRLTDRFQLFSEPGKGVSVQFGKEVPAARPVSHLQVQSIAAQLGQQALLQPIDELQRQNRDLLDALNTIRLREAELEKRQQEMGRLSVELEETNRGVVALYSELEEKAAALRQANQMKSQFLSHVSHEFRTPVNSVLALTQLLLRHTDGDLTSEQEKQVGYIRQAAAELLDMVNDLLDLAKVEAGKTELRLSTIDLGHLLGSVRALMRPLATNEAVALLFDDPPPGIVLRTDEGKLSQILRNLVSNALKYTENGEVRVSTEIPADGASVRFSVRDTGIGILPEHQERIFQEFEQIHNPLQRNFKGTGLGLPLSRKLAKLLGGSLEVSSTVGSGSTFVLTLPVSLPPEDGQDEEAGELPLSTGAPTILIIDDEETSRYISRRLLAGTRYHIVEASDGAEGAERARFERPRLILLDLVMPVRNGFEVLDELKSDPATRDIPVVIQTSRRMTQGDYDRLGNRHVAVLPKGDANRREALAAIREILDEPGLFSAEPEFSPERGTPDS